MKALTSMTANLNRFDLKTDTVEINKVGRRDCGHKIFERRFPVSYVSSRRDSIHSTAGKNICA